jgi:DNA-binding response OmpR family regulator
MTVQLGPRQPLPAAAPAARPAPLGVTPLRSQTLGHGELQCVDEIHILVLDDDPSICQVIQSALAHPDFRVDAVSDPARVPALLQEPDHYHVIILDYVLPGLSTEEVLRSLQENQADASIIVVTGHPTIESALNCLRARTYDYLTKPFQVAQLRDTVLRCLESKGLLRMSVEALQESLGASIRERRKALGLTLKEMADRTKVSLGYLSQIELGKNSASIDTLYRICLALGIKLAELFEAVQRPA